MNTRSVCAFYCYDHFCTCLQFCVWHCPSDTWDLLIQMEHQINKLYRQTHSSLKLCARYLYAIVGFAVGS